MTVEDYIERGWELIAAGVDEEVIDFFEGATMVYPESAEIWCMRGDAMQMYDGERSFLAQDYEERYRRALARDPKCAEAWESIAYLCDVYYDDFEEAETAFRRAIALGAGEESYAGLARVLAQLDREGEALRVLQPDRCPFATSEPAVQIRQEIEDGLWRNR